MSEQTDETPARSPEIWDTEDIARYLGRSRKTIQNKIARDPRFPKPIGNARQHRLFYRAEVMRYLSVDSRKGARKAA